VNIPHAASKVPTTGHNLSTQPTLHQAPSHCRATAPLQNQTTVHACRSDGTPWVSHLHTTAIWPHVCHGILQCLRPTEAIQSHLQAEHLPLQSPCADLCCYGPHDTHPHKAAHRQASCANDSTDHVGARMCASDSTRVISLSARGRKAQQPHPADPTQTHSHQSRPLTTWPSLSSLKPSCPAHFKQNYTLRK
jgi:hypothetical protein